MDFYCRPSYVIDVYSEEVSELYREDQPIQTAMADAPLLNGHVIDIDEQSRDTGTPAAWSKGAFLISCHQEEMAVAVLPVYDPAHFARRESQQTDDASSPSRLTLGGGVSQPTSSYLHTVFTLLGATLLTLGTIVFLYS